MKNFLSVTLILFTFILFGCSIEKNTKQVTTTESPIPKITRAEVNAKLAELSTGLDVRVDDMKEVTFYRCRVDIDIHPSIWIIPYVIVDENFNAVLCQNILYVGNEPLYFERLYVKTTDGVEKFPYDKVIKSYAGEEYNGLMYDELYRKLEKAISDGHAKFRLEGMTFGERELTAAELSDMVKVFAIYEFLKGVKVEN